MDASNRKIEWNDCSKKRGKQKNKGTLNSTEPRTQGQRLTCHGKCHVFACLLGDDFKIGRKNDSVYEIETIGNIRSTV